MISNEITLIFPAKLCNVQVSRALFVGFMMEKNIDLSIMNELKTVISEAVTNAIVHGYKEDETKNVTVKYSYDDETIFLMIKDDGVGIDDIKKARTPLFTTKLDSERAGLGFTIMEVFTDSLKVETKKGVGTTIYMEKAYKKERI